MKVEGYMELLLLLNMILQRIMQVCQISPRIMWIYLQYVGVYIRIFCLYAPTNCPSLPDDAQRSDFWRTLQKEVDQIPRKAEKLFLGDLNTTTNLVKHLQPTHFGRNKNYCTNFQSNENGEAMTNFCVKNSLGGLNTYFKHKNNHLVTFHSNDGHTTKTLDPMLLHLKCFPPIAWIVEKRTTI